VIGNVLEEGDPPYPTNTGSEVRVNGLRREAERRAGGLPKGVELRFRGLPPGFAILPGWLEEALPFRLPRGPIYGSEAITVVGGSEVPLGELLIVGMYDGASGQGAPSPGGGDRA
jgi:hypothetical protein